MRNLDVILISISAVSTIVMFLSAIGWIFMFTNYREQQRQLKTLDDMDYITEIAKVSKTARKAEKDIEALDENLSKLNSKLTARWRREAKDSTNQPVDTVDAPGAPDGVVPFPQAEQRTSRRERLKRLHGA